MTWLWTALALLLVVCLAVCIPIQHRALNRIAFGRSMFITFALILFGLFLVAVATGLAAVVLGAMLMALGYGFLIFIAVKSYQRLRQVTCPRSGADGTQRRRLGLGDAANRRESAGRGAAQRGAARDEGTQRQRSGADARPGRETGGGSSGGSVDGKPRAEKS
ncbi:hypothetical protein [Alicyclobacillus kakegawensis]|uniref:hypothetical protein n=1 Tax=Alicyclobacillus kakegawensis TaxID=392012 RepID=UPI00082D202D|nr:hypothetical protein [Alicyclobacillus kakegawensis]